jgi:oligopeptide/dipeptide ABC transporter ATP-binding protein
MALSTAEPLLQVENLVAHLVTSSGTVKAVDGVTFTVHEGETLGLVGESGSGKSMTCLAILRLMPSTSGRILDGRVLLDGEDLTQKSESEMEAVRGRLVSMVLQDPMTSLNPVLTAGEQVAEPIRLHQRLSGKAVWERVVAALRMLRIPSPELRLHDYPHQLSGGMRQRVVGAAAISCQPRLLIADEATTALDVTIQAQYLAVLKALQEEQNLAIIFVTHDFGIVRRMCDRVAVMYAGRIVEQASVQDLFDHPSHPYTRALLQSVPRLDVETDRLYSIEGQPPDLRADLRGCRFAPRCPVAEDRCAEYPPAVTVGSGHTAACWKLV